MIYWINGAYGVGKSTVAEQLRAKLPKAHIFDAEEVGNAVRDNYPEECKHSIIFEGYPLWRELNCKLLKDISRKCLSSWCQALYQSFWHLYLCAFIIMKPKE